MNAEALIIAKKELRKLQNGLGRELGRGKFKDTQVIKQFKQDIKAKKIYIGDITKNMISQ